MITVWYRAYITDKNNVDVFGETCTEYGLISTINDLERKLLQAIEHPELYAKLFDIESAEVKWNLDYDSCPYDANESLESLSDADLLAELGI